MGRRARLPMKSRRLPPPRIAAAACRVLASAGPETGNEKNYGRHELCAASCHQFQGISFQSVDRDGWARVGSVGDRIYGSKSAYRRPPFRARAGPLREVHRCRQRCVGPIHRLATAPCPCQRAPALSMSDCLVQGATNPAAASHTRTWNGVFDTVEEAFRVSRRIPGNLTHVYRLKSNPVA